MVSEPTTLYKLMILHMLKKVNFPLTNSQLTDFFNSRDYANYFTLQQVISELLDANLIHAETIRNSTRYELTKEGEDVLYFFGKQISPTIVEDMDKFLTENKFQLRSEVGVTADYYKGAAGSYIVDCRIREGKENLIELKISVPSEEQAISVCDKWEKENQDIYTLVMQKLL
ncbi:MAG: DUF4364 family protein [Lachnospiraceae bacterium]|nr:DUF4364 family protein [Lachnospiraceae bacterium]